MEHEKITPHSTSIGIVSCVFLLVGMIIFSAFFFDLDFLFSGSFKIIIFILMFFIGILIPIVSALRANRQRQLFSTPSTSTIQQPQTPMKVQILNTKKEEISQKRITLIGYCKYCGEKISKDSIFCPQCGTRLLY